MANLGPPPLVEICTQAVVDGEYWRVQRRLLQCLPAEQANVILRTLLTQRRVRPAQLELFGRSVTELRIEPEAGGGKPAVIASWVAHVSELSHLEELDMTGCRQLRDSSLALLRPLSRTLHMLTLHGCGGVTSAAMCHLAALTSLTQLNLSDTAVGPGAIPQLLPCSCLRALLLGGLPTTDDDLALAASGLPHLQQLDLWGSRATSSGLACLAQLSALTSLDAAWSSRVDAFPALSSLRRLKLGQCGLRGWEDEAEMALPGARLPLLRALHLPWARLKRPGGLGALRDILRESRATLQELDLSRMEMEVPGAPLAAAAAAAPGGPWSARTAAAAADAAAAAWGGLLEQGLTALTRLVISGTSGGDAALAAAAALPSLRQLDASGTGVTPHGVAILMGHPGLTSLTLSGCASLARPMEAAAAAGAAPIGGGGVGDGGGGGVGEEGAAAAAMAPVPRPLSVFGAVQQIGGLASLDLSEVSGLDLDPRDVDRRCPLTSLTSLRLAGSSLSDTGAACLRFAFPSLLRLEVSSPRLSDDGCRGLAALPALSTCIVSAVNLTQAGAERLLEPCWGRGGDDGDVSGGGDLRELHLQGCPFVDVPALRQRLPAPPPGCRVTIDGQDAWRQPATTPAAAAVPGAATARAAAAASGRVGARSPARGRRGEAAGSTADAAVVAGVFANSGGGGSLGRGARSGGSRSAGAGMASGLPSTGRSLGLQQQQQQHADGAALGKQDQRLRYSREELMEIRAMRASGGAGGGAADAAGVVAAPRINVDLPINVDV